MNNFWDIKDNCDRNKFSNYSADDVKISNDVTSVLLIFPFKIIVPHAVEYHMQTKFSYSNCK